MSEADADTAKRASRGFVDDLSPEAVSRRLDILAELSRAARYLSSFQPVEGKLREPTANYATRSGKGAQDG